MERPKKARPRDVNQLAKQLVDEATTEPEIIRIPYDPRMYIAKPGRGLKNRQGATTSRPQRPARP